MYLFRISLILVLFIVIAVPSLHAQSKKEKAVEKGKAALRLLDSGKYNEATVLFQQAEKLDPESYVYPYQLGYIHYFIGDYGGSLDILQ